MAIIVETGTAASCPFCGRRVLTVRRGQTQVRCGVCGAEGPEGHSPEEAAAAWNRRPQLAPAAADARGVVADFPGMWTTHPMTRDGAVALMGQFWHAVDGATIHYLPGEQPTAEEIAKSEEAGRIAKAIEQHVIAMLSMPFAPATPTPADGAPGERVSVDADVLAAALDDVIMAAHGDGARGGGRSEETDTAIDAVFSLVFGDAPAHDADAAGEAVRDG